MNYAKIQERIYAGYAKAALRIGPAYQWFRPTSAFDPLAPANSLGTIYASLSTDPKFQYQTGARYGRPDWFALVDGTRVQPGDYLTDGTGTWYVSDLPRLLPISCVACNRTLTVARPTSAIGVGLLPYDGEITDTPVMTNWPASVLQGTRGEKGDTHLPGDIKLPWYSILLPSVAGAPIKAFDIVTDEAGQRYEAASTELTELGWRLTASLAQT